MPKPLEVRPQDIEIVKAILEKYLPGHEVHVFGSRADGRAKPSSDLDLVVMSDHPIPLTVTADLREAFSESDLPFKVDLVDWAVTQEGFRRIIQSTAVRIV